MRTLARQVRFSVNPFLETDEPGSNGFASNPPGEGLAVFLCLWVELKGKIDPATGFIVNVVDIDRKTRKYVVPFIADSIRENFREGKQISLCQLSELLRQCRKKLADKFSPARLNKLTLDLNPFRKIAIETEDESMIYFSEKFSFAATHKLWNNDFTEQENFEAFGKCANKTGHGHNYVAEITIKSINGGVNVGQMERIVDAEFIQAVDHKNLNVDLTEFADIIPTVENITKFAWEKLSGKFGNDKLHCITVWETEKTYCSYFG